nr:DUF664 domain-containing protein [Kineococcus radiotolerans]
MAKRVPLRGEEKTSLHISLDRHRDAVLWKLEGLDEEQLRRPMTPTGTNLLGWSNTSPGSSTSGCLRPTAE